MIRHFFNRISLREKLLLSSLIWCGLFILTIMLISTYVKTIRDLRGTGEKLEMHDQWYALEPVLEAELQETLEQLNPQKTFSGPALAGRIDALARSSRVTPTINTPRTRSDDKLKLHAMRVNLQKNGIAEMIDFEEKIQQEWPYIKIDSVRITADGRNPEKLDALYIINSFEFNNDAAP